ISEGFGLADIGHESAREFETNPESARVSDGLRYSG
ncbi:MAG: hypothetical protein H6R24_2050, partial [Proteobacteria bacterium]|nr:hypothetical protein [Pseudomonadota bacterium]